MRARLAPRHIPGGRALIGALVDGALVSPLSMKAAAAIVMPQSGATYAWHIVQLVFPVETDRGIE